MAGGFPAKVCEGDDWIFGHGGRDHIHGNDGNDAIRGGDGNDAIRGGTGADVFVFHSGAGRDMIKDFEAGTDTIRIVEEGLDIDDLTVSRGWMSWERGHEIFVWVDDGHPLTADDFEFARGR